MWRRRSSSIEVARLAWRRIERAWMQGQRRHAGVRSAAGDPGTRGGGAAGVAATDIRPPSWLARAAERGAAATISTAAKRLTTSD
jgi:hypothetical protein